MNDIIIKKNSRIYRFYSKLAKIPLYKETFSDNSDDRLEVFDDVCKFVRQTLIALFLVTPLMLFVLIGFIGVVLYFFLYLPITSLFSTGSFFSTGGYPIVIMYIVITATYSVLLCANIIFNRYEDRSMNRNVSEKTDKGIIRDVVSIISQKSNSVCKRMKVED